MWIIPVILVIGLLYVSRSRGPGLNGPEGGAIGRPAPQINLISLSQSSEIKETVNELASGKVTLIHFWGTWCGPCKMEYPHLSEMVSDLQSKSDFRFLSISCESGRNVNFEQLASKTNDYLTDIGASTDVFADPQGITRMSTAERLGQPTMYYPTSILVDSSGTIRGVWEGYLNNGVAEMHSAITSLLD
ncbi:Thioredoxin [Planctomycetes bacterium CA13]|uniref:Thioredoxin n=2 Tax=Novipirellula herctigrandis TaxID=2527986 RepID=A0A5C5YP65_9BACT|nr:Thioredoxin [Planctomycetes bacterium CA13]